MIISERTGCAKHLKHPAGLMNVHHVRELFSPHCSKLFIACGIDHPSDGPLR